jgi:hypothetical protein
LFICQSVLTNAATGLFSFVDVLDGFTVDEFPAKITCHAVVMLRNTRGGFTCRLRVRLPEESPSVIEGPPNPVPLVNKPNVNLALQVPLIKVTKPQVVSIEILIAERCVAVEPLTINLLSVSATAGAASR